MVRGQPLQVAGEIRRGVPFGIRTVLPTHFLQTTLVEFHGVGEHGQDHVLRAQFEVPGELDAHDEVGDAGEAQQVEPGHHLLGHALRHQVGSTFGFVEQPGQTHHRLVVHINDQVRVLHVVNPGDVLVSNAFDAMLAEAVFHEGGHLERLPGHDFHLGEQGLEVIAAGNGAGRTGGQAQPAEDIPGAHMTVQHLLHGPPGNREVPQVVPEIVELVEDDHLGVLGLELLALVENLLDVGLGARGFDDLIGHARQPLEPLLAHPLWQDGDAVYPQQPGVERPPAAVVPGGRPGRLVPGGVELPGHQSGNQDPVRGPHLVGARGEPLPHQGQNPGRHPGERGGKLQHVHRSKAAAVRDRFVVPGNPKEVTGMHFPQPDMPEFLFDFGRNQSRVLHLGEGGQDEVPLPRPLHRVLQTHRVDRQVQHPRPPSGDGLASRFNTTTHGVPHCTAPRQHPPGKRPGRRSVLPVGPPRATAWDIRHLAGAGTGKTR